jgi:hypothetical protein
MKIALRNARILIPLLTLGIAIAMAPTLAQASDDVGNANTAPRVSHTDVSFTDLSLVPDRQTPSGGFTITRDLLTMNIDNTKANILGGVFYQTEGLQGTIPVSQSISAELYVDPAWAGKPIRAGLWGIAKSNTATDSAWPIIEYTTVGDNSFTGWRVFDTINGGWTNLHNVSANSGHWYNLEIAFNPLTRHYNYYVEDKFVRSLPAIDGSNVYGNLTGAIFNNKNFATANPANDYKVQWRDFQRGSQLNDENQCKNDAWKNTTFKNQGDCVSNNATEGKDHSNNN